MPVVMLRGAFAWECECGRENFERATEGSVPEELLDAVMEDEDGSDVDVSEPNLEYQFMADDPDEMPDGSYRARVVISRMLLIPRIVQCVACKRRYSTTVPIPEDGEDDDGNDSGNDDSDDGFTEVD